MCYFLCLAVPQRPPAMEGVFEGTVMLQQVEDPPIARVALGDAGGVAFLLTIRGCSCDLLCGGHHMESRAELVPAGVARLLGSVPRVALVSHWYTEAVAEGQVRGKGERAVTLRELKRIYPRLEEDVRYVVTR